MILAAGKGTRLLPFTESKPKALIEVQGVPLLEHTIRYLKFFGIDEIIINLHHCAQQIVDFIGKQKSFGLRIEFSDESDALLDTGGGLFKARGFFNDGKPFILTSSDVITDLNLRDMLTFHKTKTPLATLAVKHRRSSRDFIFDNDIRLCGWRNNITGEIRQMREVHHMSGIAFSTVHIIEPVIFDLITERGAFSITEVYLRLAREYAIVGFEHDQSDWFECGRFENIQNLNLSPGVQAIYRKFHRI